jgi:hypothetical protein
VSVLAWIFIVLSGLGTVVSILQNILLHMILRDDGFGQLLQAPPPPGTPPFAAFAFHHFPLVFLAVLLVSAFALVSSIGLLRRRNWARLCFIGLMVLGIAYQLAGIAIQLAMLPSMHRQFADAAAMLGGPDMSRLVVVFGVAGLLFAAACIVLFGWIVWKLVSPAIVEEFGR